MFKRRNKFVKDQYIKVWVWAESCEALVFAVVLDVQGDYVKVRYLDQGKMDMLSMQDHTFCFPQNVHFKNCCHLAYDQQEQAMKIDKEFKITFDGMKSWGLKDINFRTATMIINSTNLRETTHAPIFYTVCYAPFFIHEFNLEI